MTLRSPPSRRIGSTGAGVVQNRAGIWTLVAFLSVAAFGADRAAAGEEESSLLSFVVGDYTVIGREPGGGAAYAGTARIEQTTDGLRLERRIGGRTVPASGRLEVPQPPGEGQVLRFYWQDGQPIVMTCLVSGDLDNAARLTCLWDVKAGPARDPGQEALFSTANWPPPQGAP